MQTVIFTLLENIRVISILLQPFIPDGALKILNTIYKSGKDIPFANIKGSNISGLSINPIDQVFRKFEI